MCDSQGKELRFDPDNKPAPPQGNGVQLCYRALPHYETTVTQRKQHLLQQAQQKLQVDEQTFLQAEINLKNELEPKKTELKIIEDKENVLKKEILSLKSSPLEPTAVKQRKDELQKNLEDVQKDLKDTLKVSNPLKALKDKETEINREILALQSTGLAPKLIDQGRKKLQQDLEKVIHGLDEIRNKKDRVKNLEKQKDSSFKRKESLTKILQGKSQPIPIMDEHELAFIYLQEFYKKQAGCNIQNLDAGAILNILSKAACFPDNIRIQSAKVRDNVRNQWAHAVIQEWTPSKLMQSFNELKNLANMLPGNVGLIQELDDDLVGAKPLEFPMKNFYLKINNFRTCIQNGRHQKIQEKIKRLESLQGSEIYVERIMKNSVTGLEMSNTEDIVMELGTSLLKGEAGAGKSSLAAKAVQKWATGHHMKNITCCLFLAAGSEDKIPLYKIVWDEYADIQNWTENEAKEAYSHLKHLAEENKLAVIIDGLDELGYMSENDKKTARRAANHPPLEVDIKTACIGILSKIILPGANVFATGRNTALVNQDVLENNASMWDLVKLTQKDREQFVVMMEPDPFNQKRIHDELARVSIAGNDYFLTTPLMTKTIIQLIIERKVDIERVNNSSDIYLMVLLKNLVFHRDQKTNFTQLDPPEDQEYLISCLKICQMQMQTKQGSDTVSIVTGIQRNLKDIGQCFEVKAVGELIRVPINFIKKIGIFEYRNDAGIAYLEVVHLSFIEFCCAGSLCRHGVDIHKELLGIKDQDRFEAVTIYLAGMFAENINIDFLNLCKDLCQNFLKLLNHQDRKQSAQDILESIVAYPMAETQEEDVILSTNLSDITVNGEYKITLLLEAASKTSANIIIRELNLSDGSQWIKYKWLADLIKFQHSKIEQITINNTIFEDGIFFWDKTMMTLLNASKNVILNNLQVVNVEEWSDYKQLLEMLRQNQTVIHNSKLALSDKHPEIVRSDVMMEIIKVSQDWVIVAPFNQQVMRGHELSSIETGVVSCLNVERLCEMLGAVDVWKLDILSLGSLNETGWAALAKVAESGTGTLGEVVVPRPSLKSGRKKDLKILWNSTTEKWKLWSGTKWDHVKKSEGAKGANKLAKGLGYMNDASHNNPPDIKGKQADNTGRKPLRATNTKPMKPEEQDTNTPVIMRWGENGNVVLPPGTVVLRMRNGQIDFPVLETPPTWLAHPEWGLGKVSHEFEDNTFFFYQFDGNGIHRGCKRKV